MCCQINAILYVIDMYGLGQIIAVFIRVVMVELVVRLYLAGVC